MGGRFPEGLGERFGEGGSSAEDLGGGHRMGRSITALGALTLGVAVAGELLTSGRTGEAIVMTIVAVMAFMGVLAAPGEVLTTFVGDAIRRLGEGRNGGRLAVSAAIGAAASTLAGGVIAWEGAMWAGWGLIVAGMAFAACAVWAAKPRQPALRLVKG